MLAGWGMELDVEQECARLSVEQRQIVEIARALLQGARFIILDEPTAELEGREVRRLFDRIPTCNQPASPSYTSRTTSKKSTRFAAA